MSTLDKARMVFKVAALASAVGMAFLPGTAGASEGGTAFCDARDYDNAVPPAPQTTGLFTDLRRGPQINADYGECQLNLTGSVGSSGDMWITLLDPPGLDGAEGFACASISGQVAIHRFDNRKAIGFVANYDPDMKTGLFLGLYDNGNNDALTLSTFQAGAPPAGPIGTLTSTVATKFLGSKILENRWYYLNFDYCVDAGSLYGTGSVSGENIDPDIPELLYFNVPVPAGLAGKGLIGIGGYARYSFVDSTVGFFSWFQSNP